MVSAGKGLSERICSCRASVHLRCRDGLPTRRLLRACGHSKHKASSMRRRWVSSSSLSNASCMIRSARGVTYQILNHFMMPAVYLVTFIKCPSAPANCRRNGFVEEISCTDETHLEGSHPAAYAFIVSLSRPSQDCMAVTSETVARRRSHIVVSSTDN